MSAVREAQRANHRPRTWVFWAQASMAGIGLLVALYLTWLKLADASALCAGIGDCETVQNSAYSEIAGIPVALLGAGMYAGVLLFLGIRHAAHPSWAALALGAQVALVTAGLLFSAYLTYVELFVIYAICPWCVVSALLVTGLFALTLHEWHHHIAQR
ncbi:MAG: vitamin K epoxide reductase family protein [Ardenticatenia bacterium]|nr:vitamin K epoxide reductase family protein [Ardenticatenia bacterium]